MNYGSPDYIFYFLLLNALPESLVETMAVFSILNLRLNAKKILAIAALQVAINLILFLPINWGIHSVILLFSLAIFTHIFTRARLSRIFLAVLICFAIITFTELIYAEPLFKLTGLAYKDVMNSPFLISAFAVPYELVFLVLALAKDRYNRRKGIIVET